MLSSHGSGTSLVRDNVIDRGSAANATRAIVAVGQFKLSGNLVGFDEAGGGTPPKP